MKLISITIAVALSASLPSNQVLLMDYSESTAKYDSVEVFKSITFFVDSKEMDDNGRIHYANFLKFLQNVDTATIDNILLIGHSGGNHHAKKKYFDPYSRKHTFPGILGESALSEADLENTRFILGLGRAREIYNQLISDFPKASQLMRNKRVWLSSAGTHYWSKLKNQHCVQIVVYRKSPQMNYTTKEDEILNTEPTIDVGLNPAGDISVPLNRRLEIFNYDNNFYLQTRPRGEGGNYFNNFIEDILNPRNYQDFVMKWS